MDKEKKETICAIVVTYNRKQLLLECLESLLKQTYPLDAIYIIDNASTDGTAEILKEKGYIKEILTPKNEPLENENVINMLSEGNQDKKVKIHYVRMHENTGGAGGFYEGVKRGYEKGYDWLWLMDDDCLADKMCLYELLRSAEKNILGPFVIDKNNNSVWVKNKPCERISERNSLPFNGFMIHKEIIKCIGYPMKELFVYGDDVEYSLRARKCGYKLLLVRDAMLFHPSVKSGLKRTFVIAKRAIFYHKEMDLDRLYYYLRNTFLIIFLYPRFSILLTVFREFMSFIIFSKQRYVYLENLWRSILDARELRIQIIRNKDYRMPNKYKWIR